MSVNSVYNEVLLLIHVQHRPHPE